MDASYIGTDHSVSRILNLGCFDLLRVKSQRDALASMNGGAAATRLVIGTQDRKVVLVGSALKGESSRETR